MRRRLGVKTRPAARLARRKLDILANRWRNGIEAIAHFFGGEVVLSYRLAARNARSKLAMGLRPRKMVASAARRARGRRNRRRLRGDISMKCPRSGAAHHHDGIHSKIDS